MKLKYKFLIFNLYQFFSYTCKQTIWTKISQKNKIQRYPHCWLFQTVPVVQPCFSKQSHEQLWWFQKCLTWPVSLFSFSILFWQSVASFCKTIISKKASKKNYRISLTNLINARTSTIFLVEFLVLLALLRLNRTLTFAFLVKWYSNVVTFDGTVGLFQLDRYRLVNGSHSHATSISVA